MCVCGRRSEMIQIQVFIVETHSGNGWRDERTGGDKNINIINILFMKCFYCLSFLMHFFYCKI